MSKKFTLTLTIDGESLQEIDDQLVQAAGERLMARMVKPPTLNGEPLMANDLANDFASISPGNIKRHGLHGERPEVKIENQPG